MICDIVVISFLRSRQMFTNSGFADLVAWEPSEEEFASFHEKIMDEFSCICPFLGQALYRFFGQYPFSA